VSPARDTAGGRAFLDLQALARANGRPVQELLQLFVLEAFLDRLAHSPYRVQLVLKGVVLLAAFGERRPTGDGRPAWSADGKEIIAELKRGPQHPDHDHQPATHH